MRFIFLKKYNQLILSGSFKCRKNMRKWIVINEWFRFCKLKRNFFIQEKMVSSVQSLSHVWLFATPWTAACQASSPTPGVYSNSCPLSPWCHPTFSSSVAPFPPASNLSQYQGLLKWVSSLHQVVKVLEFQLQHQSFQWIFRTDFL